MNSSMVSEINVMKFSRSSQYYNILRFFDEAPLYLFLYKILFREQQETYKLRKR